MDFERLSLQPLHSWPWRGKPFFLSPMSPPVSHNLRPSPELTGQLPPNLEFPPRPANLPEAVRIAATAKHTDQSLLGGNSQQEGGREGEEKQPAASNARSGRLEERLVFLGGEKQDPEGAREVECFRGLLRLVSLWWELPPWLDSNLRILFPGLQELSTIFGRIFLPRPLPDALTP